MPTAGWCSGRALEEHPPRDTELFLCIASSLRLRLLRDDQFARGIASREGSRLWRGIASQEACSPRPSAAAWSTSRLGTLLTWGIHGAASVQ